MRPFCFYVFPKSTIDDKTMLFQANAINFLISNNFDFNKVFKDGIGYTALSEKDLKARKVL